MKATQNNNDLPSHKLQDNFKWDILALVILIIIFRFAAYFCLVLRARSKE